METTRPAALSRRAALTGFGAGGLGLALAARAFGAAAQEASPVASAGAVPPELQEWVAGWEAADPDRIAGAYAEDAVVEVVPFATTLPGRDAIRLYYVAYWGVTPSPPRGSPPPSRRPTGRRPSGRSRGATPGNCRACRREAGRRSRRGAPTSWCCATG